ncbi:hypothetical protein D4764_0014920 [Takifugu flavidus]|uniref:Endonuclease/exonuclease/phosphatase domain-containing protein n=1 Tax=Takifugu flavidus TaxID=433684 RepID=A0A5C6MCQ2_9TELE|nr:hypothetical protein D4764_0014920 [Takifugu flavidus]
MNIKIGTLNINGARSDTKRASLFQLCRLTNLEVLLIQETHSNGNIEGDWRREWSGQVFHSHKLSNSAGVGILFSLHFKPRSVELHHSMDGHVLMEKAVYEKAKLVSAESKALTGLMVRGLNRQRLEHRSRSPWRAKLALGEEVQPEWRSFYLPLSKKAADLQESPGWRNSPADTPSNSPPASVSVEECGLAVGEIVGHGRVKSSSRMNSKVVVFVDTIQTQSQGHTGHNGRHNRGGEGASRAAGGPRGPQE